jgi:site-specific DNA-methyltransferase (adenine-specific)/modification methylase
MKMAEKVVIGNATLYHGDCREVLPLLPAHDLLLTDPPYGIGIDGQRESLKTARKAHEFLGWDNETPPQWLFGLMHEKASAHIIWGGNYFGLPPSGCWLSWDKVQEFSGADMELAYTTLKQPSKTFRMSRVEAYVGIDKAHPTQKPAALIAWCIAKAPDAQTVLDPFMGSGTTGVACAQLGKSFTGIERERKYFDIACERISRAQAQGQLLPPEETRQPVQEGLL